MNEELAGQHQFKNHTICFTKEKFLGLTSLQQHKKCALIVRAIYEKQLAKEDVTDVLTHYKELLEWIGCKKNRLSTLKELSDQYHMHLKKAQLTLKEHNLLPAIRKNDRDFAEEKYPVHIYLDNLRSAYNVGSILRTTECLGFSTVHFGRNTPHTSHKQVQDASMGACKWVNCSKNSTVEDLPRPLIALETCEKALSFHEFIFPEEFTLILGNEEYGISEALLKNADHIIHIPMRGRKNSLNVSNAFAICAAEILRQRNFNQEFSHE